MKLHRELGISQKSAWFMAHRLRQAWNTRPEETFEWPVEVDETYMGGKRKNVAKAKRAKTEKRGSADCFPKFRNLFTINKLQIIRRRSFPSLSTGRNRMLLAFRGRERTRRPPIATRPHPRGLTFSTVTFLHSSIAANRKFANITQLTAKQFRNLRHEAQRRKEQR